MPITKQDLLDGKPFEFIDGFGVLHRAEWDLEYNCLNVKRIVEVQQVYLVHPDQIFKDGLKAILDINDRLLPTSIDFSYCTLIEQF